MNAVPFDAIETEDDLDLLGPSDSDVQSHRRTRGLSIERSDDGVASVSRAFRTVQIMDGPARSPAEMAISRWMVANDVNLIAGAGGQGKSPLLLMTAVCTAIDRPLFGTLRMARSGPVLLVLPEDGEGVARMMLDAIAEGLDLQAGERAVLRQRLVMIGDDERVNLLTDAARIRDTVVEYGAVLVCCDPIRNLIGGEDENAAWVANQVCDSLRREVCRGDDGAAVLLSHHLKKPPSDAAADVEISRHDVRGSGAWVDGSRLALGVRKKGGRITVSSLKSNRVANDLRHELDLTIEADEHNEALWRCLRLTDANAGSAFQGASSQALTPGVGRPINANERKALEAIDDKYEPDRRVSWSEWKGSAGMSEDTLKSVKRRILEADLARAIEAGQHRNGGKLYAYSITERGRKCLETGMVEGVRVRG